jgi:hypothetical protein
MGGLITHPGQTLAETNQSKLLTIAKIVCGLKFTRDIERAHKRIDEAVRRGTLTKDEGQLVREYVTRAQRIELGLER